MDTSNDLSNASSSSDTPELKIAPAAVGAIVQAGFQLFSMGSSIFSMFQPSARKFLITITNTTEDKLITMNGYTTSSSDRGNWRVLQYPIFVAPKNAATIELRTWHDWELEFSFKIDGQKFRPSIGCKGTEVWVACDTSRASYGNFSVATSGAYTARMVAGTDYEGCDINLLLSKN